jgi:hypothetical protein
VTSFSVFPFLLFQLHPPAVDAHWVA